MFDCAFMDMRALETEVLKIVSFYINKVEPLTDQEIRNVFPSVDRLELLEEVFDFELQYHNAKLELVLCHLECLEHITDVLE